MAASTLSVSCSSRNSRNGASKYWKISKTAAYLGVSQSQVRLMVENGELRAVRTVGNHRLIEIASLLEYCGEDSIDGQDRESGVPIALVARVSTAKQSSGFAKGEESDLTRQRDKLRAFIKEKWANAKIREFCRTSSGMNFDCDIFLSLVHAILAGEFRGGYVVCNHPDRILRFGVRLFSEICEFGGCEIVYAADDEQEKNEDATLADDVLSVICHFTAKKYGARAAETCQRNLTPECVARMGALKKKNLSNKAIWLTVVKEGYLDSHGNKPSYWCVCKYLKDAHSFNVANAIDASEIGFEWFKSFLRTHCVRKPDGRVANAELRTAYTAYCRKAGKVVEEGWTIGQYLSALQIQRKKSNGIRYTMGLVLRGNARS